MQIAHSYNGGFVAGVDIRALCFPSRWLHHLSVSIKPKLGGMGIMDSTQLHGH